MALAGTVHCGLDTFDVEVGGKGVVQKGTVIDQLLNVIPLSGFDSIDLSQEFENQGATKDNIDSVHVTSFVLTIEGPAGATFDFIDSIKFYAEAAGQPKVLIAIADPAPRGVTTLELTVQDAELKPYAIEPSMRITSEVVGSRPTQDTSVAAEVVLQVDANIGGC